MPRFIFGGSPAISNTMNILMFDFDGVIVDTFSLCHIISNSISPVSEDEYRTRFEGNINDVVNKAPPIRKADYFSEYTPELMKCEPFIELIEAIKNLAHKYTLVIISSTISPSIDSFLQKTGLRNYFSDILGNDVEKSKIKKIGMVLEKYKTDPSQALFITDTLGDIKEASACSVKSIAVSWGYNNEATLTKGNPYKIISDKKELVPAVEEYFKTKG